MLDQLKIPADVLLYVPPLNVSCVLEAPDAAPPGGLLLTVKLLLIIFTLCAQIDWQLALSHSIGLLFICKATPVLPPPPLVIAHAAVSLGNLVEMTVCDHRKWFRYLSLRSKRN